MTDVTVAPAGGDAAAAAPVNEVAINESPVSSPTPVGSQAPDKPSDSAREAIRKAFERADRPQPKPERQASKPAPKPAEAKAGHNNPPEETEKFDLKKRPGDQPLARAEHGHFAPAGYRKGEPDRDDGDPKTLGGIDRNANPNWQNKTARQLPEYAPYREPPQRISESARRDWDSTPETVRADIHRMHSEFAGAYQTYRGDHEAMNSIRPYHQMAQQHGTTLDRALNNYVTMEQKLRADPIGGLDLIVHNLNLVDPQTGRKVTLRDVAYYILNQSPDQLRTTQMGNAQSAAQHQIGALHQEVTALKAAQQQMHYAQQYSYTRSAVDQFAVTHPRIDEEAFGNTVHQELGFGFDLETAYRRAEAFHPATHAAQTRTTSAQTRTIDRSISGNPDVAPSNGASRRPREVSRSPREALEKAFSSVGSH